MRRGRRGLGRRAERPRGCGLESSCAHSTHVFLACQLFHGYRKCCITEVLLAGDRMYPTGEVELSGLQSSASGLDKRRDATAEKQANADTIRMIKPTPPRRILLAEFFPEMAERIS